MTKEFIKEKVREAATMDCFREAFNYDGAEEWFIDALAAAIEWGKKEGEHRGYNTGVFEEGVRAKELIEKARRKTAEEIMKEIKVLSRPEELHKESEWDVAVNYIFSHLQEKYLK